MAPVTLLFVGSTLLAVFFAVVASPIVARVAERLRLLDVPGGRRLHPRPVPRPGGLAIAAAFGLAIFAFWLVDRIAGHPFLIPDEVRSRRFTLTAVAAVVALVVGFLDDVFDLRARWQLLGHVAIAAVVVAAGIRIDFLTDPFAPGGIAVLALPIAVGSTVFWVTGMNVAINFLDGLDGLAAGVAVIAALTLGATALLPGVEEPFVAWMSFTLAGAICGFLVFNFHPAKVFLGTTGVTFLGTMLAVLSIFGTAKVPTALLVLAVPIVDTFYVLVRRTIQRRPPFAPDRGHLHHRLLDLGLTHSQSVLLIYALTCGLAALSFVMDGKAQLATFVAFALFLGVLLVALPDRSQPAENADRA
ncbi:MAG: undecaprenyl/decaprenyl-phosphate alpha-N-acetylglucosaminyl 1-phosphate transferase [Chloroflexota bacterium]|nr:undecaprenyl/decaprenyl-phosphate alpha-N-acetylglucosaminyl 1-phosphate transferase [Chloroflexota bacterium]MDE3192790.1 undecaprenyl/decaprenyl-phosphate alpha-N-acetylglucosaminyl 1-phosphate transferase [Chloroflexota bacterium]